MGRTSEHPIDLVGVPARLQLQRGGRPGRGACQEKRAASGKVGTRRGAMFGHA